jgi:molecular chaperone GrpE (heat shock protein)
MMSDQSEPKVNKLPFFLADALILGAAFFIYNQSPRPLSLGSMALIVASTASAALLGVWPFVLEYKSRTKVAEAEALTTVAEQIKNLEAVGAKISGATSQWQSVQDLSAETARAAKEVTDRMASEAKGFAEFMQRINDTEKANLRLEVDKLRRAEIEWMQVLVRMLDHVYALHQAAVRSRQSHVIEQVSHFQNACRDAARRVGLAPYVAADSETFDAQRHQVVEGQPEKPEGKAIAETLASGYTFQGRVVRPALVRVHANGSGAPEATAASAPDSQSQLPLEPAGESVS